MASSIFTPSPAGDIIFTCFLGSVLEVVQDEGEGYILDSCSLPTNSFYVFLRAGDIIYTLFLGPLLEVVRTEG